MAESGGTVRVAVAQTAPVAFQRDACLDKVEEYTRRAAADGAQLVVFPEAFVPGISSGAFAMPLYVRSPEDRQLYETLLNNAIEVPGIHCDRLAALAREANVFLVIGVMERIGGSLYCTTLYFSPEAGYVGKHQKLKPTVNERVIWGDGDAATLRAVDSPWGKLGGLICNENYMPLARTALYAEGVSIYVAPTLADSDNFVALMRTIATEGRCFVISACPFTKLSDFPQGYKHPKDADAGNCSVGV